MKLGKRDCVSLGFVGDVYLADNYTPMESLAEISSTDIADGVDQRFIDLMRDIDLMWANCEFCLSDRGEPLSEKLYKFRAKTAFRHIRLYGRGAFCAKAPVIPTHSS